jgi:uncharacterized protein
MSNLQLNDQEIQRLEEFLMSDATSQMVMNLEAVDGFSASLVVGPGKPLNDQEFLFAVWGEDQDPAFASAEEKKDIEGLLLRHRQDVTQALLQKEGEGDGYAPLLWDCESEEDAPFAEHWALGFGVAMQMFQDEWEARLESSQELQSLIVPVMLLELGEHPDDPNFEVTPEVREELAELLPTVLVAMHAFFHPEA